MRNSKSEILVYTRPPYRVLHVIDNLAIGGAQEVICQLIKYGQRRLFQPEVVTLYGYGYYWELLRSWGVPIYSLIPYGISRPHIPCIIIRLFLLMKRRRYDLVQTYTLWAKCLATPFAALCRVPLRLNREGNRDIIRYRFWIHRWLRLLANRVSHHIIAVSISIRAFLCQEEKVSANKITVIHNSIDLLRFSPKTSPNAQKEGRQKWGLPADALIVGGVGRFHDQKNFPLFLEVAAELCARLPQVMFVIAGDGPDRSLLENLSRKLEIDGKVHLLGFVKEMPEFYKSLDVLLLTSHFEGSPHTVLEALAMGVPVVASCVDGIAEVLEDGKDAFLVPPEDKELFVSQVCRLLEDRHLARRLALAGQEKVRRHYSAAAMVRQIETLYLQFLKTIAKLP